jgi:hypothetical protein
MAQRTINSPGVEIRESDLSLTAPANVGTNIYITGFAQQGPIDEVLLISTKQELVNIFGAPTNSAERYFHYSLSELLNSPSTVYASRLPYGSGLGDGFGTKYGALVYPVVAVTGDTEVNQVSAFQLSLNFDYALSASALSGAAFTIQDAGGGLSSIKVGFSGASLPNQPTYTDATMIINMDGINNKAGIATRIARFVTLSSFFSDVGTPGANLAVSGAAIGTTSVKFTLSGDQTKISGVPAVTPSVANDFTGATETFTLSAVSDQSVTYDLNVLSGSYVLGEPTHFEISESEYLGGVNGTEINWASTASTSGFDALSSAWGAGVVILNKSTTTINPAFEGFYVGISDNTNLNPATDFNNILHSKTLTQSAYGTTSYQNIPEGTLQFKLSANFETGTTNSISEVMDNFTTYDIAGRTDDDLLNVGVFKLRKSIYANESFKLDYLLEDGIAGSINYYSTQLNPNGGSALPMFLERKDENSRNISIHVNDFISNRLRGTDARDLSGAALKRIRVLTNALTANTDSTATGLNSDIYDAIGRQPHMKVADALYPLGAYNNSNVRDKEIGDVPSKIERALDSVKNNDLYDIDVVVEGGLGTIFSVASGGGTAYYDEFNYSGDIKTAVDGLRTSSDLSVASSITLRNNYNAIFNKFEQFCSPPYLGGGRGDCIFVADPIRQIFIEGNGNTKYLDDKSRNFQTGIYWAVRHQFETQNYFLCSSLW